MLKIEKKNDDNVPCFFVDNYLGKINPKDDKKLELFSVFEISEMIKTVVEIRKFVERD